MFVVGSAAAWGQEQKVPVKADRATAYYHFMLAHMYSEMAEASGISSAYYETKVNENYKAAVKADPQTPDPRALVSPFTSIYIPKPPASRQERSRP
jgi:hypothetical protein